MASLVRETCSVLGVFLARLAARRRLPAEFVANKEVGTHLFAMASLISLGPLLNRVPTYGDTPSEPDMRGFGARPSNP